MTRDFLVTLYNKLKTHHHVNTHKRDQLHSTGPPNVHKRLVTKAIRIVRWLREKGDPFYR